MGGNSGDVEKDFWGGMGSATSPPLIMSFTF